MSEHLSDNHLSKDEMIQCLYGLDSGVGRHLTDCPDCGARYELLAARRAEFAAPEEVSHDLLAAQRRAVYSRMGDKPRSLYAWVPALATAALLAVGVYLYQPARSTRPASAHVASTHSAAEPIPVASSELGDAQLFSEAVSIEQTTEPRAVAPIHGLFQGNE